MGEFRFKVENILKIMKDRAKEDRISKNGHVDKAPSDGIAPEELPEVIRVTENADGRSDPFNCYPGKPSNMCCDIAYFFSLGKPYIKPKRGHYNCRSAIEKVVMHMQGYCPDVTRHIIFVTDNWDKSAYEYWYYNLQEIKKKAYIEAYLVTHNGLSEIHI